MISPWTQKDKDAIKAIPPSYNLLVGFCAIFVTSGLFFILNEVPSFEFVLVSFSAFLLLTLVLKLLKPKAGDDQ